MVEILSHGAEAGLCRDRLDPVYVRSVHSMRQIDRMNSVHLDAPVKSLDSAQDGLCKNFDIRGVVFRAVIWQYMWYSESPHGTHNEVDRSFYESITLYLYEVEQNQRS